MQALCYRTHADDEGVVMDGPPEMDGTRHAWLVRLFDFRFRLS
jgi:hypothetical protein